MPDDAGFRPPHGGWDGTTYYGFTPLASTPEAIRKQYADWSQGLSILGQLDRVIACLAA